MHDDGHEMHILKVLKWIKKWKIWRIRRKKKRKQGNTYDRPLQCKVNSKQTQPRPDDLVWTGRKTYSTQETMWFIFFAPLRIPAAASSQILVEPVGEKKSGKVFQSHVLSVHILGWFYNCLRVDIFRPPSRTPLASACGIRERRRTLTFIHSFLASKSAVCVPIGYQIGDVSPCDGGPVVLSCRQNTEGKKTC